MNINPGMSQLLPAFTTILFILGIGFSVQRLFAFDEVTLRQLARLVVDVLLPVYLFYATATGTDKETLTSGPLLVLFGLIIPLISLLLALILGKITGLSQEQQPAYRFSAMVGNTAFLGIPICASLFGATGAIYAVLYDFGATLIAWTLGIWVLNGGRKTDWRALTGNPFILAVVAGLVWTATGWHLPEWFTIPLSTVGNATLPLALFVVGARLGILRTETRNHWQAVGSLTAIRLVLTPLIVAAVFGWEFHEPMDVILIQAAMPVGLTTAILAERYRVDSKLPAAGIFWSTLALGVTLPILILMVEK